MCGRGFVVTSLLFSLALGLSSPIFSEETVYEITEAELTELENNLRILKDDNAALRTDLKEAQTKLAESQMSLRLWSEQSTLLQSRLILLNAELNRTTASLNRAGASFQEFASEERRKRITTGMVSGVVAAAFGILAGAIAF